MNAIALAGVVLSITGLLWRAATTAERGGAIVALQDAVAPFVTTFGIMFAPVSVAAFITAAGTTTMSVGWRRSHRRASARSTTRWPRSMVCGHAVPTVVPPALGAQPSSGMPPSLGTPPSAGVSAAPAVPAVPPRPMEPAPSLIPPRPAATPARVPPPPSPLPAEGPVPPPALVPPAPQPIGAASGTPSPPPVPTRQGQPPSGPF